MRVRTSASDIESEVKFPSDAPRLRFNGCAKGLLGQEVDGISPCYAVCFNDWKLRKLTQANP